MLRTPEPKEQAKMLQNIVRESGGELGYQQALHAVARLAGHKNWNVMQAYQAPAPTAPQPEELLMVHGFSAADVRSLRPDLSDAQAEDVLREADRRFDANIGLNWDVLETHADCMFPPYHAQGLARCGDAQAAVTFCLKNGWVMLGTLAQVAGQLSNERRHLRSDSRFAHHQVVIELVNGAREKLEPGENHVLEGLTEDLCELADELRQHEQERSTRVLLTLAQAKALSAGH